MGGTDPNNFLNSIGKEKDGSGNGDILLWKRKAERYLVEVCLLFFVDSFLHASFKCVCIQSFNLSFNILQSGLSYSIIHPGGEFLNIIHFTFEVIARRP